MSVKARLTVKRLRELPEYVGMVRRIIAAQGRRVAGADPEDLAELAGLHTIVDRAVAEAVAGQRSAGFSWAEIGRGLGITRQAAQQRYGDCGIEAAA
jgi:hypothetical protein